MHKHAQVARAGERGLGLRIAPALMEHIVAEGHSDEYGARPLRQAIVRCVRAWAGAALCVCRSQGACAELKAERQ